MWKMLNGYFFLAAKHAKSVSYLASGANDTTLRASNKRKLEDCIRNITHKTQIGNHDSIATFGFLHWIGAHARTLVC